MAKITQDDLPDEVKPAEGGGRVCECGSVCGSMCGSVWECVWECVWEHVRECVWEYVREYVGECVFGLLSFAVPLAAGDCVGWALRV